MKQDVNARVRQRALVACVVAACIAPFAVYGAYQALANMRNDVLQWTSSDLEAKRTFDWFGEHFEGQEIILVSWPGCSVDDPRLDRFAERLRQETTVPAGQNHLPLIESVTTGADVWRELTTAPANFSPQQTFAKLRGVMIGPDGKTSGAVVVLTKEGTGKGQEAVTLVQSVAGQIQGLDPQEIKLAGYSVQMAAIDRASLATMYQMAVPAGFAVMLAAWFFLRNVLLTLSVGLFAAFCQAASLAMVYYLNVPMSGMLTIMPVLIIVIFVSGSVHLINYYNDAVHESGPGDAPTIALRVGGFPCFLAVVTSAIGIASLTVSNIQPVRVFGWTTSLALIITVVTLLTLLPGVLLLISHRSGGQRPTIQKSDDSKAAAFWSWLAHFIQRFQLPVQLAFLALTVLCAIGLWNVQTSMQLRDFFLESSRIVRDYRWVEDRLGPIFPSEVVLRFDESSALNMHDRLRLVTRIERAIRKEHAQAVTVSAATFTASPVLSSRLRWAVRRAVMLRKLEENRARLLEKKFLKMIDGDEYWRISVRLPSLSDEPFDKKLAQLQRTVEATIQQRVPEEADHITAIHTGLLPLVANSQAELLHGLIMSLLTSVFLIGGALIVGLRSVRLGILSTLPNFFPIIIVFGGLGWLGRPVDIGTMMTASIGLGIAVDDTVHFLTWFKRSIDAGFSRREAACKAYLRCGSAIVRTTIICGAAMILFAFSSFGPARQFGNTICWLLGAALIGDLLLLPALLVGPIGRLVIPDQVDRPAVAETAEVAV